jgi:LysM repeat protein
MDIPADKFPEPADWWDQIDGKVKINNVNGKVYWSGGDTIGMALDFLDMCDKETVIFDNNPPEVGDIIEIPPFKTKVVASKDTYSIILCERVLE